MLNGKVKCIFSKATNFMVAGKKYDFKNGYFTTEGGIRCINRFKSIEHFNEICHTQTEAVPVIPFVKLIIDGIEINEKFNILTKTGSPVYYNPHYFDKDMRLIDSENDITTSKRSSLIDGSCIIQKIVVPSEQEVKLNKLKELATKFKTQLENTLEEIKQIDDFIKN